MIPACEKLRGPRRGALEESVSKSEVGLWLCSQNFLKV